VASFHAQIRQKHLKTDFLVPMSNWTSLRAAVKILKIGTVVSQTWLDVEYQSYRGLSELSNGYELILTWSTVSPTHAGALGEHRVTLKPP
jgi:hypothetical protein